MPIGGPDVLAEQDVLDRLDSMIRDLAIMPPSPFQPPATAYPRQIAGEMTRVVTSAVALCQAVFGEASVHVGQLTEVLPQVRAGTVPAPVCKGIIQAARDDFEGGYYVELRHIVAAEVFDDLLDMAEHLRQNAYHLAAASVAGAVLEDSLRKLCGARGVDRSECRGISALNDRLKEAEAYEQPQWRQIQVWGDLRNQVDHHDFENADEVDPNDVKRMIEGLQDFIVRYLT